MQTTTAAQATSKPLIFARHMIGMGIVALANPLMYYDREPIGVWLMTCFAPLVGAIVVYGLYAVFLTERAKRAWPKSFFTLAWVLLVLVLIGQWSDYNRARSAPPPVPAVAAPAQTQNHGLTPFNGELDPPAGSTATTSTDSQIDWEKGVLTPPSK